MNSKAKKKWVAALRSGKYLQGYEQLRRKNKFCCLGVLCDINKKELGKKWKKVTNLSYTFDNVMYSIPLLLRKKLKISNQIQIKLIKMNDNKNTFEKIANYIEKYL